MDKRLTNEQCKILFEIMKDHTYKSIAEVLKFASEHDDYDFNEVKTFIRNNFEVLALISDSIVNDQLREVKNNG